MTQIAKWKEFLRGSDAESISARKDLKAVKADIEQAPLSYMDLMQKHGAAIAAIDLRKEKTETELNRVKR